MLAVIDLIVGVSNDAVNFINAAIGSKVARFRTIIIVASVGVFVGAAMSNGMMDVARHGIMNPACFSFHNVITIFLAVMVTDVLLLDIFNNLGMPTSTTVSLVFELLGGTLALAAVKLGQGMTDPAGELLRLSDMLNTDKAVTVVLGIFLSVAIAFFFGFVVQWLSRLIFTFTYRVNGTTTQAAQSEVRTTLSSALKIGVFGGISITCIIWFLLVNGLKSSTLMTPEVKAFVGDNAFLIIGGGIVFFSALMTALSAMRVAVLKLVVLTGTFALAMAFAGNDLVNFVGVPLTGLDAYHDYTTNGMGRPDSFMMDSLGGPAQTPVVFLLLSGVIMVLALVFSKKAHNVVKTSVDLSRQDQGDEMFGSSGVARTIVRQANRAHEAVMAFVPRRTRKWVNSRFNSEDSKLEKGAAFDLIRASVNLVLAGILVAIGTSHKLPLSTTYVTFMVAMGTSLADRAWGRESAVFRITGVISVIGGWFVTAGVAFAVCFILTLLLHYGGAVAMGIAIVLAISILIRSNLRFKRNTDPEDKKLFDTIVNSNDLDKNLVDLRCYLRENEVNILTFIARNYEQSIKAFIRQEYRILKRSSVELDSQRQAYKRTYRREIIAQRHIDPIIATERNSWYYLTSNSFTQMLYCLKRITDPCLEHIGNSFTPLPNRYASTLTSYSVEIERLFNEAIDTVGNTSVDERRIGLLRRQIQQLQEALLEHRKQVIADIQGNSLNITTMTLYLSLVQESHILLSNLRHSLRGIKYLMAEK